MTEIVASLVGKGLTLPLPPSTNNLFATVWRKSKKTGKRVPLRIAAKKYAAWKDAAGWTLKTQERWRLGGPVNVAIYLPLKMAGDIDNRVKAILDLLVKFDWIDDDKNVRSLSVARSEAVSATDCRVYVEAA